MNSGGQQDANTQKQETSAMGKFQAVEFTLNQDQFTVIQHFLPKGYTLVERKSTKRQKVSSHKLIDAQMSRFSGGFDNTQENQGRSKRQRTKKIDRYLQDEIPRATKRVSVQKLGLDDDLNQCAKILTQLKKNPNAIPFLEIPEQKRVGIPVSIDYGKEQMDLYTVEKNLKGGQYQTSTQFHADINKVWYFAYKYNDKNSKPYKMAVQMEKYYKKITTQGPRKRAVQSKGRQKMKNQTENKQIEEQNDQQIQQEVEQEQNNFDNRQLMEEEE